MSTQIEDYALIGDRRSAALVSRAGSVDWLCWPRFDSDACFAALLGDARHGCWRLAPADEAATTMRRYRTDTMILETTFATAAGRATVTDLMPIGARGGTLIRRVSGESGEVGFTLDLALRFDYGAETPWLHAAPRQITAIVGPDLVVLRADVALDLVDGRVTADFSVKGGETVSFVLQYGQAYAAPARAPRSGRRSRPGDCRDRALLAGLGAAVRPSDRLARRGAPLAADPARAEPRGHRRHDRRADHLAARNSGRRRQLGLSLQLAAQLDLHLVRPAQCRLQRRGSRLARLAFAGRRRRARANAHGLSLRRRSPVRRTRDLMAAGP